MKLSDLKSLRKPQIQTLERYGWTVESLSTATPDEVTGLKGIGKSTAKKIIHESGRLINAEKLAESKALENVPEAVVYNQTDDGEQAVSVRVQRIRDKKKSGEMT